MRSAEPRKVALIANCLLNQNAKVCQGARYRGVVTPVVEALRSRGYESRRLTAFLAEYDLPLEEQRRWRV